MNETYEAFFERVTGQAPHAWQRGLGDDDACRDRLLRIPTGFGKTAGAVLPWLYHRVQHANLRWPTRLVLVLPMRVLAEQTRRVIHEWLSNAAMHVGVGLHLVMGGADGGDWHLRPESPAILIGTQDMWLSRALMRGYASGRARWPVDFGLVHQDALWVFDEVQLMDVGLATSAQLWALRQRRPSLRPTRHWWMSATLQPGWLETYDAKSAVPELVATMITIPPQARTGPLFEVVKTMTRREDISTPEEIAALALEHAREGELTLVIANTVDRAADIHGALVRATSSVIGRGKSKQSVRRDDAPELHLVHSRFRGAERENWSFLRREACSAEHLPLGRIVVATQVVEAGVDVSAATLITDLAPWPSLVQRFGRCARYAGQRGQVLVCGAASGAALEKLAGPYAEADVVAAAMSLPALGSDASLGALEAMEEGMSSDERATLYRYDPFHVLRMIDLDELFDTSADLSGSDIDPSRFIRSGDERDVTVFWRVTGDRSASRPLDVRDFALPQRRELCRVPLAQAREWLSKVASDGAWSFDYVEGQWLPLGKDGRLYRVTPGHLILVSAAAGGYSTGGGFDPKSKDHVPEVPRIGEMTPVEEAFERSAAGEESDDLSSFAWRTIATHGSEVASIAAEIGHSLGFPERDCQLLSLAARWHDLGKSHPTFQDAILDHLLDRRDLAKAPATAWRRPPYPHRPGFRHELASMLAIYETLRRAASDHPALADDLREFADDETGAAPDAAPTDSADTRSAVIDELLELSASEVDLVAFLVLSHHGKLRCGLASTQADQMSPEAGRIAGVASGDVLPATHLAIGGGTAALPELTLSLALARMGLSREYGRSWVDRVASLRAERGEFVLSYLEAVLRAADARASMLTTPDPTLEGAA